jgi:hypothetical protein
VQEAGLPCKIPRRALQHQNRDPTPKDQIPTVAERDNGAVLVYDDRWETRDARDVWHDTAALIARVADGSASHDDLIATLIAFGAYESAQADALCPTRDEPHPTLTRLRAIAELLGRAVSASIAGDRSQVDHAVSLAAAGCRACDAPGPSELRLRVPEGYAFYSLYPESYAEAIVEWAIRVRPERVVALGLRSIGTSLSAAVTGALTRVGIAAQSWTLRPRGHPFDRRIDIAPSLAATLPLTRATILIVDEGPGLSGSSMTATAAALSALGVPDEDVVFVPSWQPDPATFVSSAAADRWRRHRAIVPTFDGVRRTLASDGIVPADAHEISAGAWRAALHVTRPWPAVHPQHERRKFLLGSGLARFAGLGAYRAAGDRVGGRPLVRTIACVAPRIPRKPAREGHGDARIRCKLDVPDARRLLYRVAAFVHDHSVSAERSCRAH